MTEVLKPEQDELLAEMDNQPRVLRIRAGEVHVELEWPTSTVQVQALPVPQKEKEKQEPAVPEPAGLFDLCAPTVGTFYVAPEPGAAPFVREGDQVRAGQQVGIVEAMKLMIPIEAERDGQVIAVLAANGKPVEYGDRLFTFTSSSAD